jgi:drug/metabolite transporter (DMT)-like permease
MPDNRYSLAGGLAIAQAILFPLAFGMSIVQDLIGKAAFKFEGPTVGPSDLLFIIFTVIGVYVLIMFRKLLNERYNYHGIDTLIIISIWWSILFQISNLIMKAYAVLIGLEPRLILALIYLSFFIIAMLTIGIVDILIAVRLLKIKDKLNDLLRAFAYITIIAGILEASIVLSPLALILVPVTCVILGMIFLREKEEVEFV